MTYDERARERQRGVSNGDAREWRKRVVMEEYGL